MVLEVEIEQQRRSDTARYRSEKECSCRRRLKSNLMKQSATAVQPMAVGAYDEPDETIDKAQEFVKGVVEDEDQWEVSTPDSTARISNGTVRNSNDKTIRFPSVLKSDRL
eukprot:gene24972-biopygen10336